MKVFEFDTEKEAQGVCDKLRGERLATIKGATKEWCSRFEQDGKYYIRWSKEIEQSIGSKRVVEIEEPYERKIRELISKTSK